MFCLDPLRVESMSVMSTSWDPNASGWRSVAVLELQSENRKLIPVEMATDADYESCANQRTRETFAAVQEIGDCIG